ncbi:MAG: hypothetical protein WC516_09080 [Patescibacteria group bacterium]
MSRVHQRHWRSHAKERFEERVDVGISYNKFEWKWFRKGKYQIIKSDIDIAICIALINNIKVWFIVKTNKRKQFIATFLTEEMAMLAIGINNNLHKC